MYLMHYTLDDQELEADAFQELQHAIVETMRLAEQHADQSEFVLAVIYQDQKGDLFEVFMYNHQNGFVFEKKKLDL